MEDKRVLIQVGPQAPKQRCVISPSDDSSPLASKFQFLFDVLRQIDTANIAFVGHVEAQNVHGDTDLGESLALKVSALARYSNTFSHRCVWRAFAEGQIDIGVWNEGTKQFDACADITTIPTGSTVLLAIPTSVDPIQDFESDAALTLAALNSVEEFQPEGLLVWLDRLLQSKNVRQLDERAVREVVARLSAKARPRVPAQESQTKDQNEPLWTPYPRKAPQSHFVVPKNMPLDLPSPPKIDVQSIFSKLHKKSGGKTLSTLTAQSPKPPLTRYQMIMASQGDEEPTNNDVGSEECRIVDVEVVADYLKEAFPQIDHGNGLGYSALIRSSYERPLRGTDGHIVAGYGPLPSERVVKKIASLDPPKAEPVQASKDSELGSALMKRAFDQRAEVAKAKLLREQKALKRRPPPNPFMTESEFLTLMAQVVAL